LFFQSFSDALYNDASIALIMFPLLASSVTLVSSLKTLENLELTMEKKTNGKQLFLP